MRVSIILVALSVILGFVDGCLYGAHAIAETYYDLGLIYARCGLHKKAVEAFSDAIKADRNFGSAYNSRGASLIDLHELTGALQDFDQAILLNPNDASAYGNRVEVHLIRRDFSAALADSEYEILLAPEDAHAYCGRGIAWYFLKNSYLAMQDFEVAMRLDPTYVIPHIYSGIIRSDGGDRKGADADFQTATKLGIHVLASRD